MIIHTNGHTYHVSQDVDDCIVFTTVLMAVIAGTIPERALNYWIWVV